MTNREPKRSASRGAAIKWGGFGVFALSAICLALSAFVDTPGMPRAFYLGVAAMGLFVLVCELIYFYVILPPTNDGDDDT